MTPKPESVEVLNGETQTNLDVLQRSDDNYSKMMAFEVFQEFLARSRRILSPEDFQELIKLTFQGGDLSYIKKM